MKRTTFIFILLVQLLVFAGCKHTGNTSKQNAGQLKYAQLLELDTHEGYTVATLKDPWHRGATLHTYVLVPCDAKLPATLPKGTLVRTPVSRALVYSSVHTSLMRELGAYNALKGVVDAQYFNDTTIERGIKSGALTDCGSSMTPNIEKVIEMRPDAILLSPYQDANYGQVTKLNIPLIECADYMEHTPLGRAEWIKFYGELFGARDKADSIFNIVVHEYEATKTNLAKVKGKKPVVLTENVISGVWNVPGGQSYMARLIVDAGGDYPWAADTSTGSLSLDFNQVLAKAKNADIWLIKSFNINTYNDLGRSYELNNRFDAFTQRHVWVCNTATSHFFDRFPFHPEVLLREYAAIFHPQEFSGVKTQFFNPMTE